MSKKSPTMSNKMDTLRHRPFLIIEYWYTPSKQARTHKKGWMNIEENVQTNENPYVADSINTKHITTASVIIDLLNKRVVKCRFNDTSHEELIAHFTKKYATQINEAVTMWIQREQRTGNPNVARYMHQMPVPTSDVAIPEGGLTVTMV